MTKVKICGLTQEEHVRAAVEAGADAIGFVFAPSSRQVTLDQAKKLAAIVPDGVLIVGVFVNETKENLRRIFKEVPLDYIQYHGDESPKFIRSVGLPAIRAFSIQTEEDVKKAAAYDVGYYLFDAPGVEYKGGSGKTFDWSLLENAGLPRSRVVLAGGLNESNIREAVRQVGPGMVDVSSGVEIQKRKDPALIQAFIRTAKEEE